MQEIQLGPGFDLEHSGSGRHAAIRDDRFGSLRRQLGDELGGGHADTAREVEFVRDATANVMTDLDPGTEERARSRDVEKRLVECDRFDVGGECFEHFVNLTTHFGVMSMIPAQKDRVGTQTTSLRRRHRREDPVTTSLVIRRRHHPTIPGPTDHHRTTDEFGVTSHFHGHVKGVHVDVKNAARRFVGHVGQRRRRSNRSRNQSRFTSPNASLMM